MLIYTIFTSFLKIVEIKSKYVHAFQETMVCYEILFPGKPGFRQIRLEPLEKEGDLPKNLKKILKETTSEQAERSEDIEQLYKKGMVTLGIFANFVGRNVLEVLGNLMNNPDLGIRCCLGNSEERDYALSLLNDNPRLIVDVISLMTFYGLGVEDTIVKWHIGFTSVCDIYANPQ